MIHDRIRLSLPLAVATGLTAASLVLGASCSSGGSSSGGACAPGAGGSTAAGGSTTGGGSTGSGAPGGGGGSTGGGSTGGGSTPPIPSRLNVGVAAVVVTPPAFEGFVDTDGDGLLGPNETFLDTGGDRLFSWEEPGALGADGLPGIAGVDDDADGQVDESDEYLAAGSDDVPDPNGDDYHGSTNPNGTEGDGQHLGVALAGFGGVITGGFSNIRYAIGVMDDLWARTVATEVDGVPLIWQSIDMVGLFHIDMNPVKRRAETELGIPASNIVISATHSHSGPDPVGIWRGGVDNAYMLWVRDRMFESIARAWAGRQPAIMTSATGEMPAGYDRVTHEVKHGDHNVHQADGLDEHLDPANGYDVFLNMTDLRDPIVRVTTVGAMKFDAADGSGTIATLVNGHNHPEVLTSSNLLISSDWPHFTREMMESRYGGTCVYVSGLTGCQIGVLRGTAVTSWDAAGNPEMDPTITQPNGQPFPRLVTDKGVDKIRSLGYTTADVAIRALDAASPTPDPTITVDTEDLLVDLENPLFMALGFAIDKLRFRNADPRDYPVRASGLLSPVGGIMAPVTVASIGDAQLVTSPGEMSPEYFLGRGASRVDYGGSHGTYRFRAMPAFRDHMTGRDKFVSGISQAYLGYLVPSQDYLAPWQFSHPNFYEDAVSAGWSFGDNVGNKVMQMLGSNDRYSSYPIRP